MLPNRNLSAKSKIDKTILESEDWKAAKERCDVEAADRVIGTLWSEKKLETLKAGFKDPTNVVFITVPSTSGKNVFPLRLASILSKEFNGRWVNGDEYFSAVHSQQSKYIPRLQRPFHRREYVPENIGPLKREIRGKSVLVVDDIMTTGGSVSVFCLALQDQGMQVESVIALMGDHRLSVDRKTVDRLDAALKKSGLPFNGVDLAARLTRVEAGGLIVTINSARSENAKQRLAGNLHGLLDQRPFADLGRDSATERYPSLQRADLGDAKASKGISTRSLRDAGKERVGGQRVPAEKRLYQITVESKTTGRKYTELVTVNLTVSKDTTHDFLRTKARELSAKVAAKHHIKNPGDLKITVKPIVPETEVSKVRGIDRSKRP